MACDGGELAYLMLDWGMIGIDCIGALYVMTVDIVSTVIASLK